MRPFIYIYVFSILSCSGDLNKTEDFVVQKGSDSIFKDSKKEIVSDSTEIIEKDSQQLEIEFMGWRCKCPPWITASDRLKYQNKGLEQNPTKYCFYIEPASSRLILPDSFFMEYHDLLVTGKFVTNSGFPKGYDQSDKDAQPAKVFRYTKFKIVPKQNPPY